jgi:hypothetical protein
MGRHTDPTGTGSRRAAVLTLTASALLVVGGLATLHQAGGLRPSQPYTPSVRVVTPSNQGEVTEPGRTPASPDGAATPSATSPTSPQPSLTTRPPEPLVLAPEPAVASLVEPSNAPGTPRATGTTGGSYGSHWTQTFGG